MKLFYYCIFFLSSVNFHNAKADSLNNLLYELETKNFDSETLQEYEEIVEPNQTEIRPEQPRFKKYGLNQLMISTPEYAASDTSLEGQYSLRYTYYDKKYLEGFFSMTGRFDFYAPTRTSGPVVNRDSKPAFHIACKKLKICKTKLYDKLTISAEHWSNGHLTDVDNENNVHSVTSNEYQMAYSNYTDSASNSNLDKDRFLVDSLSRSMNYVGIDIIKRLSVKDAFGIKYKIFIFEREDQVFAGRHVGESFKDYDLATISYTRQFSEETAAWIQQRIGNDLLATDSFDIGLRFKIGIPLTFQYHYGPFQRLSDYTRKINVYSFGFIFAY